MRYDFVMDFVQNTPTAPRKGNQNSATMFTLRPCTNVIPCQTNYALWKFQTETRVQWWNDVAGRWFTLKYQRLSEQFRKNSFSNFNHKYQKWSTFEWITKKLAPLKRLKTFVSANYGILKKVLLPTSCFHASFLLNMLHNLLPHNYKEHVHFLQWTSFSMAIL